MRISIFGVGYVGVVASGCLAGFGHDVIGVDIAPEKIELLRRGISPVVERDIDRVIADAVASGKLQATTELAEAIGATELSFISVGTPSAPDGSSSLAAVEAVARDIGRALRHKTTPHAVVMRSTVPPGTAEERIIPILEAESGRSLGDGLEYYSNPEFLREGSSVQDFHAPAFHLIGARPGDDAPALRELYAPIPAPVHVVPYRVAESVKYLGNVFHAVKLAFANEAGAVLKAHGVDARAAFRLFCEDRTLNISPAYLRPGFAFGGSCLPKDLRAFLALSESRRVAAPFLANVLPSNQAVIERAYEAIAAGGRRPVALFGLAFKQGTDDLRESPFVALAEKLIGKGFPLRIFDRFVRVAHLLGSNRAYIEREIPHLETLMTETPEAALDGARVAVIGHLGADDLPRLGAALTDQLVLDLAGVSELRAHPGIEYRGVCW
ncbi:MAG TPA: nucleotide sugar dehydrogenase [Acetobacteraceae bacterium]|nr:nucleotide sugar dehydrogenase [Acetobacteraceae bacterium]